MAMRLPERLYATLGVIYYEQGIIQALRAARGDEALRPGSSDPVSTAVQFGILAVLGAILVARRRDYLPLLRPMAPYLCILALCFASTAWSDNPLPTLRRSTSLAACVLFGTYLWRSFGLEGATALAGRCAVFLGVLSVLVFVAVPSVGRETALGYENAMRGVFSQKNPMAECMLLGIVCFTAAALRDGLRLRHMAAVALLLGCIALGRSATSLGIAAAVLGVAAWLGSRGRPRLRLLLGFAGAWLVLAIGTTLLLAPELAFSALGRDASLTGRGPLWQEVVGVVARRPLFGHGYAGFWNEDSRDVQYLWLRAGWRAPDSHNGYLDVTVQLGLAGLAAYLFLWGRVIVRTVAAWRWPVPPGAPWVALFMMVNVLLNLDEGPLPFANGFSLMMPCALIATASWHALTPRSAPVRPWGRRAAA